MRVAIVGFGIGGAALSIALARDGHEVTAYEHAVSLGPVGAGFLLQPSGQAVLAGLGLLDEVRAAAWPIRAFHAECAPGRTLAELRYDRRDPSGHALGVARGRLFMSLMAAAMSAGAGVVPGIEIIDAIEAADRVTPISADGSRLPDVDLLVGADGLWSAVRGVVDTTSRLRISPFAALWGLGQTDELCPERLRQQARGVAVLVGLLPVGPRETAVFWGLRHDQLDAVRADGLGALVQRVALVFPEARSVLESTGGFDHLTMARYGHASIHRRHTDRIVLIGDAAHPSPPHLGQGANLALLDAAALAGALRAEPKLAAALRQWDRSRRWQNLRYTLLSRAVAPFFQSSHGWLGAPRDIGLPIMTRLPPTRAIMERVLAGHG